MSIDGDDNEIFLEKSKPIHGSIALLTLRIILSILFIDLIYFTLYYLIKVFFNITTVVSFNISVWFLLLLVVKGLIQLSVVVLLVIQWATTLYFIEGNHLITKRGILNTEENVYDFNTIRSLEIEQSILGRLLHYGNIILKTSASGGYQVVVTLLGLADPIRQEKTLNRYF